MVSPEGIHQSQEPKPEALDDQGFPLNPKVGDYWQDEEGALFQYVKASQIKRGGRWVEILDPVEAAKLHPEDMAR